MHKSLTLFFISATLFSFTISVAQQSAIFNDTEKEIDNVRLLFQTQQYSLALPILNNLTSKHFLITDNKNASAAEINFYWIACRLMLADAQAEIPAKDFMVQERNTYYAAQLSFYLAQYYFGQSFFDKAAVYYQKAHIDHLTNAQIMEQKFRLGYCFFLQKKFEEAQPLFDAVRKIPNNPFEFNAQYYYGFISFYKKDYAAALDAFDKVKTIGEYSRVVPFYVATIYFLQGNKEQALAAGEAAAHDTNNFYATELKQLIGHAYFEKKQYSKALPLLEAYRSEAGNIPREVLYELSFCYYQLQQFSKAIEGLKQLGSKEDSLGQHAMYLLGDAYLKINEKQNARHAFAFCADNNSHAIQREIAAFIYAKLSFELGYQDIALLTLRQFIAQYPASIYYNEAKDLLVQVLASTSNYKDALELLVAMDKPTEATKKLIAKIYYGRAVEYLNDGELNKADELLTFVLKDRYSTEMISYTQFWKGEIAFRHNKFDEAIRYYNQYLNSGKFISQELSLKEVNYNLGYCYLKKENYTLAKTYFEKVTQMPSPGASAIEQDAYLRSADCYYMIKEYKKANAQYETVIRNSWQTSDYALYQKAMIAGISKPSEKIKWLNTLQRMYPASEWIMLSHMELASTFIAEEKFKEAIPELNTVLKASGNSSLKPKAYLRLGIVYNNLNKEKEALEAYQKLVREYPNSDEAMEAAENIKSIYVETGKTDEYLSFMQAAGKNVQAGTADSITFSAAELKYSLGECNGALPLLKNYLTKFPEGIHSVEAHYFMAECLSIQKDLKNAVNSYEAVVNKGNNRFAENASLKAARLYYFEWQDYAKAEWLFDKLQSLASTPANQMEAWQGLLRSRYRQKKYKEANDIAKELLKKTNISNDDKALANLVNGKNYQLQTQFDMAINAYKQVMNLNKGEWAAEARFETAQTYFLLENLAQAEKAAFEVINKSGSYDYWVTKAYLLLGDVYVAQKDFFNARATYKSVSDNATILELKNEAKQKLKQISDMGN